MAATTADGVTVNGEIKKMITLISSDGESFEATEAAAAMSSTIANMIEDDCVDESGVRLPNVAARILAKVLEYCNKHAAAEKANSGDSKDAASASEDLASFDAKFVDKDDMDTLYNLLLAANFLDIKGLLDLCAQATADIIKVKKVEEIRQKFGIQNDFTKEEEQEIRNENRWAFE